MILFNLKEKLKIKYYAAIGGLMCAGPSMADMPWEGPMTKLQQAISGPLAKGVAAISIAVAGITWALGAGGDIIQRVAKIVLGISVAVGATSLVSSFFTFSGA
jgi:type IV secretory pathway VirB2 component (pilin)